MLARMMMVLGVWALASGASAQVTQGQFKLSLDTELVSYQRIYEEFKDGDSITTSGFGFGPGAMSQGGTLPGPVGITVGYVAHRHIIPQLAFSFGIASTSSTSEYELPNGDTEELEVEGPRFGSLLFSPRVEVPFNPDSRAVFGAIAGLDFRRFHYEEKGNEELEDSYDYEETLVGYGVTVGATGHFFIAPPVSLDVSALLTLDKLSVSAEMEGEDLDIDYESYRQFTFGILIGLSAWPGA
jgi:hypothetical protein